MELMIRMNGLASRRSMDLILLLVFHKLMLLLFDCYSQIRTQQIGPKN